MKGAFWLCSLVLLVLFCVPYIEGKSPVCLNGLFEMFCIILVFPTLVWLGASGRTTDKRSTQICKFLGDISFPLYAIHYPLMYLFYAWLIKKPDAASSEVWLWSVVVYVGSIVLAYICLKAYDEPVRRWLSKHWLKRK